QVAGVGGNRTRQRCGAALTGFEDRSRAHDRPAPDLRKPNLSTGQGPFYVSALLCSALRRFSAVSGVHVTPLVTPAQAPAMRPGSEHQPTYVESQSDALFDPDAGAVPAPMRRSCTPICHSASQLWSPSPGSSPTRSAIATAGGASSFSCSWSSPSRL